MRSSAVEHCLDTAGVTGSIPVAPTIRAQKINLKSSHIIKVVSNCCDIVARLNACISYKGFNWFPKRVGQASYGGRIYLYLNACFNNYYCWKLLIKIKKIT